MDDEILERMKQAILWELDYKHRWYIRLLNYLGWLFIYIILILPPIFILYWLLTPTQGN
jgi:hypothetical protein